MGKKRKQGMLQAEAGVESNNSTEHGKQSTEVPSSESHPDESVKLPTKAKDIDDIFSKLKSKQKKADEPKTNQNESAAGHAPAAQQPPNRQQIKGSIDDLFGENYQKKRKTTEEGYRVFSEDELGLSKKGGDTDLCPFDCQCCF